MVGGKEQHAAHFHGHKIDYQTQVRSGTHKHRLKPSVIVVDKTILNATNRQETAETSLQALAQALVTGPFSGKFESAVSRKLSRSYAASVKLF
jgi:hypothetical protein